MSIVSRALHAEHALSARAERVVELVAEDVGEFTLALGITFVLVALLFVVLLCLLTVCRCGEPPRRFARFGGTLATVALAVYAALVSVGWDLKFLALLGAVAICLGPAMAAMFSSIGYAFVIIFDPRLRIGHPVQLQDAANTTGVVEGFSLFNVEVREERSVAGQQLAHALSPRNLERGDDAEFSVYHYVPNSTFANVRYTVLAALPAALPPPQPTPTAALGPPAAVYAPPPPPPPTQPPVYYPPTPSHPALPPPPPPQQQQEYNAPQHQPAAVSRWAEQDGPALRSRPNAPAAQQHQQHPAPQPRATAALVPPPPPPQHPRSATPARSKNA